MSVRTKRLVAMGLIAVILLMTPLIAMQFTTEVKWNLADFIVAAGLLFGACAVIEVVIRGVKSREARIAMIIGVLAALVLVWIELAVGIFGTPFAGS